MRSRVFVWIATGICALALSAGAGLAKKPTVKNRQGRQVGRIHQGAASGSLTRREAHRLGHNQARIHRSIVRDRVDGGVFTPRERVKAQSKLNKQSGAIYKQKHDGQTRP